MTDPIAHLDQHQRTEIVNGYLAFLRRRSEKAKQLLAPDPYSIDAIIIAMTGLTSLAELTHPGSQSHAAFTKLLIEHCPSFEERLSIPELLYELGQCPADSAFVASVRTSFRMPAMSDSRLRMHDPLYADFLKWLDSLPVPRTDCANQMIALSTHSRTLFRHYRNSVVHTLNVAKGREAIAHPFMANLDMYGIFYSNVGPATHCFNCNLELHQASPEKYVRFGAQPLYLIRLLEEAADSVSRSPRDRETLVRRIARMDPTLAPPPEHQCTH